MLIVSILPLLEYLLWDFMSMTQKWKELWEIQILIKVNSSKTGECEYRCKIQPSASAPVALTLDFAERKDAMPAFDYFDSQLSFRDFPV